MGLNRRCVAALLCGALVGQAPLAAPVRNANTMLLSGAWSRPTPPGVSVGAVYLSIKNTGTQSDRVLGASTPIAANAEFHQSLKTGGVMSMRPLSYIECPAGADVEISPRGVHIMLTGLKRPLELGSSYPLTLQFRDAGSVSVTVSVMARE